MKLWGAIWLPFLADYLTIAYFFLIPVDCRWVIRTWHFTCSGQKCFNEVIVVNRTNQQRMEAAHLNTSVLVVEDEVVARLALDKLLTSSGYHTTAVASGEEALRVLHCHEGPHVALIDLDLPGMDGAELLRRLRNLHPETHAVIMTATSNERVRELVGESDVPHLRKPLDFRVLLRVLAQESKPN
jgi:CheY-like chemotaxis protein